MSKTNKSSWKAPFGLVIFVWITVLISLLVRYIYLSKSYTWSKFEWTYNGTVYYNYVPLIISVLASFLPLLTFPVGKRMRGHQRLLAFTLFLVSVMIFIVSLFFDIRGVDGFYWEDDRYYHGVELVYHSNWTSVCLPLYRHYFDFGKGETVYFWGYLQVIFKYILCFLPLLAFPIANKIHKKNKGIKAVTIGILLLVLTCWSVNLYAISFDAYGSYWFFFTIFDADGIKHGLFYLLGIGLVSLLPLVMIGITGPRKEVEKHYEVTKVIYCPIERNE